VSIRKHFYCEGGQALAQVAQEGCEVSISGDAQKLARRCPGQLALEGPF